MITLSSMGPTKIRNWTVQGSVMNNETICLIFTDAVSKACVIRFFLDEDAALIFLQDLTRSGHGWQYK